MKKITSFFAAIALVVAFNASAQTYVKGKHYVVLDKPVKTVTGDKIEIREFFWYYCPHCFNAEPYLHHWASTLPDNAQLMRHPAVFRDSWKQGAVFYYVLEELNEVDRLHGKLFEAIHVHKTPLIDQDDFVEWLADHGVDKNKAEQAYKSFSVRIKLNKAVNSMKNYPIKGVPAIVVNGKYWTDSSHAGSIKKMLDVVDYLVKKESK